MTHNGQLYIETVGCQMNLLDSELVVAALRKQGYELTGDIAAADTVLFNTCSVREHAEHKIYSALGRLKYSKQSRPNQVIGVLGCMAQKDQELIFKRAPHVDIVVGTGQLAEVPTLIEQAREHRERALAVSLDRRDGTRAAVSDSFQSYDPLREPQMRPTPYQAFVRIMIGCDKFCTYCVVPMTRGPEQSRPPRDIVHEVKILADQGVKEVTLLGQTVNSYHFTQDGRSHHLADLLSAIHDIDGIVRIKFVTNYPKDMSDDLLQAVRDLKKCARYFHVPAQSGCDDVLKRMKRGYTIGQYREMFGRIRDTLPTAAVSSDFIVGFCDESEESHRKSLELIRECRFKNSFIFKYSPRPGTKAFELLPDNIPEEIKRQRNQELLTLQNQISAEDNAAFIGETVEILVEGPSRATEKREAAEERAASGNPERDHFHNHERDHGHDHDHDHDHGSCGHDAPAGPQQLTGRTLCDRIVVFDGNPRLAGELVTVRVEDCTPTTLIGSIVTNVYQHGTSPLLPILV